MFRRSLIIAGLLAMFLPVGTSCNTREPVIWSWPLNKRRIMATMDGFHELHMDFNRIFFDMEEYPIEPDFY